MKESFYVYIMASGRNGTLYIGMTSNLPKRIWEHKNKVDSECFTAKYDVTTLVYYELQGSFENAVRCENRLKFRQRNWKKDLIEKSNPPVERLI
ncbi:MAG: endonuclease [Rickettsiaceae bacterium]|jgi:putative endonuclease|nr:endonuclease [Rickettsiaceae bacterium]